jgi:hypothetical protein
MAQYLMSVYHVDGEPEPTGDVLQQMHKDVGAFNDKIQADGTWVFGGGLHSPDTATVVDATGSGDVVTTDGPFPEAKEQIGGFWIIETPDLDAALQLAAEASAACRGPVEVRPFQTEAEVEAEVAAGVERGAS